MELVLKNGRRVEVDTKYLFSNQYNGIDGKRYFDKDVAKIIDDARLGDYYISNYTGKRGSYEEVKKHIDEYRAKINKCDECSWYRTGKCLDSHRQVKRDGNNETINEYYKYELVCGYKEGGFCSRCAYDIEQEPVLLRDKDYCYFCEHPEGIPNNTDFIGYIKETLEMYGLSLNYWNTIIKYNKKFGSYNFEIHTDYDYPYFEFSNCRKTYRFYYNFKTDRFVLIEPNYSLSYKEVSYIDAKNFDKFFKYFNGIVKDY